MTISNNLNTMNTLEQNLAQNANEVAKIGTRNTIEDENSIVEQEDLNLTDALVEQTMIPIAYTAQAKLIEVQDTTEKSLLDILA